MAPRNLLPSFFQSTKSLKTVLSTYLIPISIIPVVVVSLYATREFESSSQRVIINRAIAERDTILNELETRNNQFENQLRIHAENSFLVLATKRRDKKAIQRAIRTFPRRSTVRVYTENGKFLAARDLKTKQQIPYISRRGLRQLRIKGLTANSYFREGGIGFTTVFRTYLRATNGRRVGILEEEFVFGNEELADIRRRRQIDSLILERNLSVVAGSFAVSNPVLKSVSKLAFKTNFANSQTPLYLTLGQTRYAAFLYDLPSQGNEQWGYLALLLSMTELDGTIARLKLYMVYLTAGLVLLSLLLILIVSRRLVRPIEALVTGMKRIQSGRLEQIPEIDSTYEIEYLVRSFNDMARNIHATKRALELRLKELRKANADIKYAQSSLVQSAKMASLGQIVAGVAHELNNPIAFIYSNMHHLLEYVEKLRKLFSEYEKLKPELSEEKRAEVNRLIKELDIEYIFKDIEDLTKSCVDGATRTKEIVLGLRTFSRMDESTFQAADLVEGIKNTLKLLVTQFKGRITVHEEYETLPLVECNVSQLNQVFMNLISNAAQAIRGKGEIWIRTKRGEDEVIIEIEDTGEGMPPEVVEQIFDPFFTTKNVGEGTGLGLSIAYGLVQKHNGHIRVQSELGKGTVFRLYLPIDQPEVSKTG